MKQPTPKQAITLALGLAAIIYGVVVFAAYTGQQKLLYHPDKNLLPPEKYGLPMAELETTTEDGVKVKLWYRPANPDQPTLVYFHGNAGNLSGRAHKFQTFIDNKYGVLAVSYRGYGNSEGTPDEQGLYKDARATIRWLEAKGVPQKDMILYGESLGTGVAVQMATEFNNVKGLTLEAPFTSMVDAGRVHYPYLPVSLLLKDRFDSLAKIKDVHVPVLVVQGELDEVVPVEQGKELFEAANEPKKGRFLPGFFHGNIDVKTILVYLDFLMMEKTTADGSKSTVGGMMMIVNPGKQEAIRQKMIREGKEPAPVAAPKN